MAGSDQSDSLSQRDTGWLQFYCEDAQEVDTVIQAYRIAEQVLLPVMVAIDGFFTSHFIELHLGKYPIRPPSMPFAVPSTYLHDF